MKENVKLTYRLVSASAAINYGDSDSRLPFLRMYRDKEIFHSAASAMEALLRMNAHHNKPTDSIWTIEATAHISEGI